MDAPQMTQKEPRSALHETDEEYAFRRAAVEEMRRIREEAFAEGLEAWDRDRVNAYVAEGRERSPE